MKRQQLVSKILEDLGFLGVRTILSSTGYCLYWGDRPIGYAEEDVLELGIVRNHYDRYGYLSYTEAFNCLLVGEEILFPLQCHKGFPRKVYDYCREMHWLFEADALEVYCDL